MNYQAQTTQFGSKTRVIKLVYLGQQGQTCYDFSTRLGTSDSRRTEAVSLQVTLRPDERETLLYNAGRTGRAPVGVRYWWGDQTDLVTARQQAIRTGKVTLYQARSAHEKLVSEDTIELPSAFSMGGMRRYGWEKFRIDVKPVMIELTEARRARLEAESAYKTWLTEYRADPVRATSRAAPAVPGRRTKAAVIYTTVLRGRCECCGENRRVEWFGGANLPEPTAPLVGGYWDQEDVPC
jgi:hypothetical protein